MFSNIISLNYFFFSFFLPPLRDRWMFLKVIQNITNWWHDLSGAVKKKTKMLKCFWREKKTSCPNLCHPQCWHHPLWAAENKFNGKSTSHFSTTLPLTCSIHLISICCPSLAHLPSKCVCVLLMTALRTQYQFPTSQIKWCNSKSNNKICRRGPVTVCTSASVRCQLNLAAACAGWHLTMMLLYASSQYSG